MPSTHTTAGAHRSNQRTSSASVEQLHCWSSLHYDLLGEIYLRLAGPLDRARFAAACTSWRAAASRHPPPPALPWLMLDPRAGNKKERLMYCPQDGAVLRCAPLRSDNGAGGCFVGCHDGGWVAWSEPPFGIVNLFSGAEVAALSSMQKRGARKENENLIFFRKIIFSEALTSHGCILAAITENNHVAICTVGCLESGWISRSGLYGQPILDIAFCNGDLYGLTRHTKELNKFQIGMHEDGAPFFKAVYQLAMQNPCGAIFPEKHSTYIVELCGKIVMAVRRTRGPRPCSRNIRGPFYAVFELVDTGSEGATVDRLYKWTNVTSLGDHALFLGPSCSKAVHVPADGHGYARRNHIYYSHHRCFTQENEMPRGANEFLTSSSSNGIHQVYYKEDASIDYNIEGIMSVGYYVRGGQHPPMWIFPPDL